MQNLTECKNIPHSYSIIPIPIPHSRGEYWHEPSGKLYKGCFKRGLFHGRGELLWFTDKEDKKKYIGEFIKGKMNGKGEMK